ncbi:MAG: ABC transporter permease subunit [Deltaproteobacteria bacterium]|nr:ABC transporter permease subunit [Deltaproteobacteria bacterium]
MSNRKTTGNTRELSEEVPRLWLHRFLFRGAPTLAQREQRLAYVLLGPPSLIVLSLIIFPILWNFWLAFHRVRLLDLRRFAWWQLEATLNNFITVFMHHDFWPALRATLLYTTCGTLLGLLMGLGAAMMVHCHFRGRGLVRSAFLIPYIAPIVAVAFAWRFILDPRGVLMAGLLGAGILEQPINLLSQRPWAMISLIAFEGWRYFPFDFLFILARLQAIPPVFYEAAAVDGATPLQKFFYVTLPQLKLVLATLLLLRFMWTFNKFDDVFLVTRGTAGTRVLTIKVYDFLIGEFNVGAGAAMALVLFAVLGFLLCVYLRAVMGRAEEE